MLCPDGMAGTTETAGWLRGQLAEMIGRLRRADAECDRLRAELEEARQHIRAQDEVDRILAVGLPPAATGETGPIARVQGPRTAAHRAPRTPQGQRWLKVVPAFLLAVAGLKWWTSRRVLTMGLSAAMIGAGSVTAVTMRDAPAYSSAPPRPAVTVPAAAVTIAPPAVIRRNRRRERKPSLVSVPPPVTVTRPSPSPSSPSPAPSVPQLTVPAALDLGVYVAGQVVIGNPQGQAVPWSVTCGQDAAVTPSQGVLEPGQQGVQLQVQVDPAAGADGAVCTFWPGGSGS